MTLIWLENKKKNYIMMLAIVSFREINSYTFASELSFHSCSLRSEAVENQSNAILCHVTYSKLTLTL